LLELTPRTSLALAATLALELAMAPALRADATAALEAGNKALEAGRIEDAKTQYSAGFVDDPEAPALHYSMGLAHLRAGEPEKAGPYFQKAAELARSAGETGLAARALYNLGLVQAGDLTRPGVLGARGAAGPPPPPPPPQQPPSPTAEVSGESPVLRSRPEPPPLPPYPPASPGADLPGGDRERLQKALGSFRSAIQLAPEDLDAKYNYLQVKDQIAACESGGGGEGEGGGPGESGEQHGREGDGGGDSDNMNQPLDEPPSGGDDQEQDQDQKQGQGQDPNQDPRAGQRPQQQRGGSRDQQQDPGRGQDQEEPGADLGQPDRRGQEQERGQPQGPRPPGQPPQAPQNGGQSRPADAAPEEAQQAQAGSDFAEQMDPQSRRSLLDALEAEEQERLKRFLGSRRTEPREVKRAW